jgi:hypothetical protein
VPGQVYYNATRKLVLQGSDGVIFVVDSQRDKLEENLESWKDLEGNLREQGLDIRRIPLVIQYNKRDLPNILSVSELDHAINILKAPTFEAAAVTGEGVFPTLKKLSSMVLSDLNKQYGVGAKKSSRKPSKAPRRPGEVRKVSSGELSENNLPRARRRREAGKKTEGGRPRSSTERPSPAKSDPGRTHKTTGMSKSDPGRRRTGLPQSDPGRREVLRSQRDAERPSRRPRAGSPSDPGRRRSLTPARGGDRELPRSAWRSEAQGAGGSRKHEEPKRGRAEVGEKLLYLAYAVLFAGLIGIAVFIVSGGLDKFLKPGTSS